ncbi:MAG: carboxypeptidase [Bacillota bacterium]|nr:carboxypeptidase [Bacillota bacterium]
MDQYFEEIKDLAVEIFENPELGFEEWKTRDLIRDYVKENFPAVVFKDFARTGFSFSLPDRDKDLKMCFLAELDAIYLPNHLCADKESGAAHACGHNTQVAIALALFRRLMEDDFYKSLDFNVDFIFVPAEEYVDLDHRKKLRQEGEIFYFGGKPEAMRLGVFDDYDFCICTHVMGGHYPEPSIEFLSDLSGFFYKFFHFKGKSAHAGFDPWQGINASSMAITFQNVLGLLRQQIDDSKMFRMNPVYVNEKMGFNTIPDNVSIGTDIRANDIDYLIEISQRLDHAAQGSAYAFQGQVEIHTEQGYLPFIHDRYLSQFGLDYAKDFPRIKKCYRDRPISAAGDIGDLAFMMPCVQVGYSGYKGNAHGVDFIHEDLDFVLSTFPDFLKGYLAHMSGKIDKEKLYRRTYKEYCQAIKALGGIVSEE